MTSTDILYKIFRQVLLYFEWKVIYMKTCKEFNKQYIGQPHQNVSQKMNWFSIEHFQK